MRFTFALLCWLTLTCPAYAEEHFAGVGIQAALNITRLRSFTSFPIHQLSRRGYLRNLLFRRLMELKPLESL